ncbi:MAG: TerB family tellurite resistance protein [Salibacteraceae bacterium]
MDARQHLYYAFGILAYAIAKADGEVQPEERERLQDLIYKETGHEPDFDYAEIIFNLLCRDGQPLSSATGWAMEAFEKGKHQLGPMLQQRFLFMLKAIAKAHPPITPSEQAIISNFYQWLEELPANPNA